jgi:SNF family Na+-dependent transporter
MLVIFVFPALAVETTVAQFFRKPVPDILAEYSPKWIGIVYLEIYVLFVVGTYYIYVMAYAILYIFYALFGNLDYLSASPETLLLESHKFFNQNILKSDYNPSTDVG